METIDRALAAFSSFMWGTPLVILLVGGGLYFLFYSRFTPYRYFFHTISILAGKFDNPNDPGDISHFQALSTALAATIGMGNVSGVAVAIAIGGPGAVFWLWMSAIVGMATKFFTCTLSIMYRGKDTNGDIQGGTMYMIVEGLGKKWKPLAILFAVAGLFGPLPIFQANQVTQIVRDVILIPNGLTSAGDSFTTDLISGLVILSIVSLVIFGGIKKIGKVAPKMVVAMVVIYVSCVLYILAVHFGDLGHYLALIVTDAFKGEYFNPEAAGGGAIGALIVHGTKRAAFSNEAGIGTATLAHGAAKTKEPVREGLIAMMEPFIDTLLVCTMTALAILVTGVWQSGEYNGIMLTAHAFQKAIGHAGVYVLLFSVLVFAFSSLFTYSYYSTKCLGFLIGADKQKYFNYFYAFAIIFGSVATINAVLNFTDGMFALMAIPTMTVAIVLSPKVREATNDYISRMKKQGVI